MISLTPTGSPAETSAAYTLLAIIADPKAAQARLDALTAEKTAAVEAMDNARAATKQAADDKAAAQKKLDEATRKAAESAAAHDVRAKQLDDHDQFLTTKQARLDAFEEQLSKREADLVARENAVKASESAVAATEQKIQAALADAEKLKAFHEEAATRARAALAQLEPKNFTLNAETGSLTSKMGAPG